MSTLSTIPFLGHSHHFIGKDPWDVLLKLSKLSNGIFELKMPGTSVLILGNHHYVSAACKHPGFHKSVGAGLKQVRDYAGDGLFTAYDDEESWEVAHQILRPGFGPQVMKKYLSLMWQNAERAVSKLKETRDWVDVYAQTSSYTLETISLCGFDYSFGMAEGSSGNDFITAMNDCLAVSLKRAVMPPWFHPLLFLQNRRYEQSKSSLFQFVDAIIDKRLKDKLDVSAEYSDFLSLMLQNKDRLKGRSLSKGNIRYQLITFLIAGHETTSSLLSFALYVLSSQPEIKQEVLSEIEILAEEKAGAEPSMKDILGLVKLGQLLKECLRLWSPAPFFGLQAREKLSLNGYPVEKGKICIVLLSALHRDQSVWGSEAEMIKLERFNAKNEKVRDEDAFKPFGNGKRACIGRHFAMTEALVYLYCLLSKTKFRKQDDYRLEVESHLTINPKNFRLQFSNKV